MRNWYRLMDASIATFRPKSVLMSNCLIQEGASSASKDVRPEICVSHIFMMIDTHTFDSHTDRHALRATETHPAHARSSFPFRQKALVDLFRMNTHPMWRNMQPPRARRSAMGCRERCRKDIVARTDNTGRRKRGWYVGR